MTEITHTGQSPVVAARAKAIWIDLLNVPDVADSDNFVELGGDSIAATLCINRIRTDIGVDLPVTALLFDDATFGSLVTQLDEARPLSAR